MRERQLRAVRGASSAAIATLFAAVSHTVGGGSAPSLAILLGVTALAWPLTTALVGRRLRAGGLAAAVLVAQVALHLVFSLTSGLGGTHASWIHQHHDASLAAGGSVAQLVAPSATMLVSHGLAAIASFVLLYAGERMLRAAAAWTLRILRRAIVAAPRPGRVPRTVFAGVRVPPASLSRGPVRRRGPPLLWGDATVA